jgi:hypothetical protein
MSIKYKIVLTCYDPDCEPYFDEIEGEFGSKLQAQNVMYQYAISEADGLNESCVDKCNIERIYGLMLDDNKNPIVYIIYHGNDDITKLTEYKVVRVGESGPLLRKYNSMLREKYGEDITVKIKSYTEDDGSEWYYYTSRRYGDSDAYETIEEAYKEADCYLDGVGVLW